MITQPYTEQVSQWPTSGRHILAQYDDRSIIVYQAYRPSRVPYFLEHQKFGGEFRFGRMSWIKPNFLWMMYRSGWASKVGQERVLAIRLPREFFDELLALAVPSSFDQDRYTSVDAWQTALRESEVRLQWDPDHDPFGKRVERRALQLGLRGQILRRYARTELLSIEDITSFVLQQRDRMAIDFDSLVVPIERVYRPDDAIARAIGLDVLSSGQC